MRNCRCVARQWLTSIFFFEDLWFETDLLQLLRHVLKKYSKCWLLKIENLFWAHLNEVRLETPYFFVQASLTSLFTLFDNSENVTCCMEVFLLRISELIFNNFLQAEERRVAFSLKILVKAMSLFRIENRTRSVNRKTDLCKYLLLKLLAW